MSSSLLLLPPAMAGPNNINPDGRTQTSVSSNGGATDVHTSTFSGSNALNSFSSFGVGDGQTVNLHLPGHSANLINLVSGPGVTVNGILNGIKNNQVGGNVFFATPNGFVVGTHGVINVGSLTVSTPTQAFVTDFFSAPSAPVEDALNALLSGSAPLNASGYISINGIVNASGSVRLNGGSVNVSGAINRGARFVNATSDFTDVVNANGLEEGTKVVEIDGRMVIVADTGTGTVSSSDGSSGTTSDATTGSTSTATAGATGSGAAPTAGSTTPTSGGTADAGAGTGTATGTDTTAQDTGSGSAGSTPDTSVGASGEGAVAVASTAPVAAQIVDAESRIDIAAEMDVTVSGTLAAKGSTGVSGGTVNITAGNNIALVDGARILVTGQGANSSGGIVNIFATNSAVTHTGALVDSSAGTSGSGGAIEFSAKKSVELAGGEFRASATNGARGSVLIDPENITVSTNQYFGGADHTLIADNNITVNDGVVVSTRNVTGAGGANQETAASIGSSGNLTIQAGTIDLKTGSKLVSFVETGSAFTGGDISLIAGKTTGGSAAITAVDSLIKGNNVNLTAQSSYDDTGTLLPVTVPTVSSKVDLNNTTVSATGSLTIGAKSTIDTTTAGNSPLGTIVANSDATVDVRGTSAVTTGGDAKLSAESKVTAKAQPAGSTTGLLPADASVAVTVISSTAKVRVSGTSDVQSGGALELEAKNMVDATTVADGTAGNPAAVGGSVAVTELTTVTKASIDEAATTQSTALSVKAESKNTITNSAKAASKGAKKQTTAEATAAPSETEAKLDKYKTEGASSDGTSVDVAAAVAIASLNSLTQASIGSSGVQSTAGLATVSSESSNSSKVDADGSAVGGSADVGVGAAVALNLGVLTNTALIGDNAQVNANGLTLQARVPVGKENEFTTSAKSGAGAKNVGVAGALAINTVANTTTALLQGDSDLGGTGATVNAGTGDILIEAGNASTSTVTAGAEVETTGAEAKVGVGASVGVNVVANKTIAEVADKAVLTGGANMGLNAKSAHTMETTVTGGAAGAKIAITPVVAVSIGDNSTIARLGESATGVGISGAYSSAADQSSEQTTVATGQTQGNEIAVGASIAVGIANDKVLASVERNITATTGVGVDAKSVAKSDTSATASVAGGQKADDNGDVPEEEPGKAGKTVDQQVAAQGDSAKVKGKANADKAPAAPESSGGKTGGKLDTTVAANKTDRQAPKAEADSDGDGSGEGVSVAAAVGVNVANSETTASIGKGRTITSTGGALSVTSTAENDASAKADGSQTDAGGTDVGIGAAVAVNSATAKNTAIVSDNTHVSTKGLTIKAGMDGAAKNDFVADAKSGAGAGNVGVAGSLAINVVDNTTTALLQGDTDTAGTGFGTGATVNAGTGDILIEAANASTSTVKAAADVKGTGDSAKVGVGASIGVNVAVNKTVAEVADKAVLTGGANMGVNARANHELNTELVGGAAGAKTSITPVVAVSIGVNTTQARVGESATDLGLSGAFSSTAEQTHTMKTKTDAQAQGDTAVGASLAVAIAVDDVSAELQRGINTSTGVELIAKTDTSITTEAIAGAKGAKQAKKDASGNETPEANTTVDEQKKNQADFAKSKNAGASGVDTNTKEAKTPDTTTDTPDTDKPTKTSEGTRKDDQGKKISVAAAIGVGVARNKSRAEIGDGLEINAGAGELKLDAQSDTNYTTKSTGEAVSDDTGVGVAVSITVTNNETQAILGAGTTVIQAGDVNISAESRQNRGTDFQNAMSAEAVSGASGGDTAVAGALAVVVNENKTLASVDEGATLGSVSDVGKVSVTAEDTSKISALARAGAKSTGSGSKTGVGASFAVLVSQNENQAVIGRDADKSGTFDATAVNAESVTVKAAKNRVSTPAAKNLSVQDVKDLDFNTFKPSDYLASNNYYTEAIAGAAAKGNTAVAGAFSVNVFANKNIAELGESVTVVTTGSQAIGTETLGVEVSSLSDMQSVAIGGAAAGAKQTGVGISNADTVNLDETRAEIGSGSQVTSNGTNAGVKVSAESLQEMTNVAVSAGASTSGTAVAGVLGVVVALGETEARIDDGATVKAKGDISVKAKTDITGVMVTGGVAASGKTGVGASIAAQIVANSTKATIGNADVSSAKQLLVDAQAAQDITSAVVAGAGAGTTAVAGALSVNVIVSDTKAMVETGAQINTDAAFSSADQGVSITAKDETDILAITGGGAGGGTTGVGAALATDVMAKTVNAGIADGAGTVVKAKKDVVIDASAKEDLTSITVGFAGGGTTGVGGAVSVAVVKNDVHAMIGSSTTVDADGNVGVNAQDDITAVLAAGGLGGGGTTGVGGSIGVATLLGTTKATVGNNAVVNARGTGLAREVYTGETAQGGTSIKPASLGAKKTESAKGLSVTAYNREQLTTTVVSAGGGGTTGVAATVSADVIANTTEASIGQGARINASNSGAGADQQVRVKAVDETSLINSAGGAGGGGSAGVGAAANVGVIAKTTTAKIGKDTVVNATNAVEVEAASLDSTLSITAGLAGGGSVGVGGALGGVAIVNTTEATVEDSTSAADAAKINVTGGDLTVSADEFANSWMVSGGAAAGGSAGVGASLSVAVNASTTKAKIGDYAETNATGTTSVKADSTESVNTVTVAGGAGGSAGVSGSIAVNVVTSKTEAGIGHDAKVNQTTVGQNVDVQATDVIKSLAVAGAVSGGGAAGVGGTVAVTVAQNTTQAYIGDNTRVSASQDVDVNASSDKEVDSATVAGAAGGSAGVAGAVSIVAVGMLLDGESKDSLGSTAGNTDDQTKNGAVGNMLGSSAQSQQTKADLDAKAGKLSIAQPLSDSAVIPGQNTQARIGANAQVKAGQDVSVTASDKTTALVVSGGAAGGGAAGVAGAASVVLLRDSAAATIADGAKVDAGRTVNVNGETQESVFNVGLAAAGGGAAGVNGSAAINVVSSETVAAIGNAQVNRNVAGTGNRSVLVGAKSDTSLITVAGSAGAGGAAAVGGVLNVNTLSKKTNAHIAEGAAVDADKDVRVEADSEQKIIAAAVSVQAGGAAGVGGAVAVNVINNNTEAFIGSQWADASKNAANIDSSGNVVISAADDTLVQGVAVSAAGAGGVGASGTVGVNVVTSETRAYLGDDSTVNARGNATAAVVYDGTLNNGVTRALPGIPGGKSGNLDVDGDGVNDGDISGGASFSVGAQGDDSASTTADSSTAKDSSGNAIANVTGGLGTRGTTSVKGLSIGAVSSEKLVTTTVGLAVGGAAGIALGATANVISSVTEARIGDGAQVNQTGAAGADPSVRVKAADDTFVFMAAGTVAGGATAGISGSVNTAVVGKTTNASMGDADVQGGQIEVKSRAKEELFLATANVSAGAAGVGAAVSVGSVSNTTTAHIDAGATVDATGNLRVTADQDTDMDLYTLAGAGGVVGVSGAVSVGVVDNTTKAYVEGAATAGQAATLNAGGTTEVGATSNETLSSITASGAAGGVGVAASIGVKVLTSETSASIGNNTRVNQTRSGAAQDVNVHATDTVELSGGGGGVALGGVAVGAMSDTNIVRNTTTANIGNNAVVDADRDITVSANSTKNVESTAVAIAGGLGVGVGGTVSVAVIGASLDADSQEGLGDGQTATTADSKIQNNEASEGLGDSEYLVGTKSTLSAKTGALGVKGNMNESSVSSQDKTQASVGNGARLTSGRHVNVAASDRTQLDIEATGAGFGGVAGIGAAVGVGITNSTTEAFVGDSAVIDSVGNVTVQAAANNLNATGSRVNTTAGAGGFVGLSAAVAVLEDTSTTKAYLGSNVNVERADTLLVKADTNRKASTTTLGASGGALAVGASVATATFGGSTSAYFQSNVDVGQMAGKLVNDVTIRATDGSVAHASATAGAAGIFAGSGAVSTAKVTSGVSSYMGSGAEVTAQDDVTVTATATPETSANAKGVSIGAGSVGASLATASTTSNVEARVDAGSTISGDKLDVVAQRLVGAKPTTSAVAFGASGGLLFGINATLAKAESAGTTRSAVGDNATLNMSGATQIHADSNTLQTTSGVGISIGGLLAVGADYSEATSNTVTEATLGNDAKVTAPSLTVNAESSDANYAHGIAGSGGLVSAPFSEAKTTTTSQTRASTGSGNNNAGDSRKIDVGTLNVRASHSGQFDAWMKNTNASLVGASGAQATNTSSATTEATLGATNGYVQADNVAVEASNSILKSGPGAVGSAIPGLTSVTGSAVTVPTWNVESSSGGLADFPAAGSKTTITNDALAQIGASTTVEHVAVIGATSPPGTFSLDAWNQVVAKDRVKMASGGAISAASGNSTIKAETNDATVRVGDSAIVRGVADIKMGARSVADISTAATVDVYGLVGVAPEGEAVSRFSAVNTIDIGAARLEAQSDIKLNAGANSSGTDSSSALVVARSDVFNNTAIPVNKDPVADAIINTHSQINVAAGADVGASRDIHLYADEGTAIAEGVGVGKDIYREALAAVANAIGGLFGADEVSFETRTGRSVKARTSNVTVDGDVHTGINRNHTATLNAEQNGASWSLSCTLNGLQCEVGGPDGIFIEFQKGIAADINDRINYLRNLADGYAGTAAAGAYLAEIAFLEHKLVDLGLATVDTAGNIILGTGGGTGISPRGAATSLRDALAAQHTLVVNVDLPPVQTLWDSRNTTLTNANTNSGFYQSRLDALEIWKTEAAKASGDQVASVITNAKLNAYNAEQSIVSNGGNVGSFSSYCTSATACGSSPNTAGATTQRNSFNSSVKTPAQTAFTEVDNDKTRLETQRDNLQTSVAGLTAQLPTLSAVAIDGPAADFVTLPNITAQLGSIRVKGDSLTGGGKLRAPGDAKVTITNNTPNFLVVQDITIDAESARLNFNGVDVNNKDDINRVNAPGAVAAFTEVVTGVSNPSLPEVIIKSNFDPDSAANPSWLRGPAPDIRLVGDFSNPRGLVQVHSKAGSILSQGNIFAGTVDVKADNGDFVQSYTDNFFHAGGDPRTIYETKDAVAPVAKVLPGGILANGSVFISARYLNINGTVQSGIANYALNLPTTGAILTGSASLLGLDAGVLETYRLSYLANPTTVAQRKSYVNDAGVTVTYDARLDRLELTETNARLYAPTALGQSRITSGIFALVDDYGNISANYDTVNDRYVLDGTSVKGGYIQLYGQIMNTASPGAGTGQGGLKVLDGYGQINITNPSGKDIVLGKLDTGRGVAGVIDITDIQYIDSNSVAHSVKSHITRENGVITTTQTGKWTLDAAGLPLSFNDTATQSSSTSNVIGTTGLAGVASSRTATYKPQPGLAFTYSIGSDESTVAYYSYSGHTFFGLFDFTSNLDDYKVAGPVVLSSKELPDGRILTLNRSLANGYYTSEVESVANGTPVRTTTKDYSSCDPWFCITQTYHLDFNIQTPSKVVTNKFLRADNPFNITFIGEDTGTVTVNSAQNVILTGAVNNKTGTTTIVAGDVGAGVVANKNIVQGNETALISTKDLNLVASGSIGGLLVDGTPDPVRIEATGLVNAAAANGNVVLDQTYGNLRLGQVVATGSAPAGKGKVILKAEGSISAPTATSLVQGNSIDLTSTSGGIGSIASPLEVRVGYSNDPLQRGFYGVTAAAQGDIGIAAQAWAGGNANGDLLVNTAVSKGGDVKLVAPGTIVDNNPVSTTDTRSEAALAALWDEMRLRGAPSVEKANETVAAFAQGKENNYRAYWRIRNGQADGGATYNAAYAYKVSADQRVALLASGMTAVEIGDIEADQTSQYHKLNADVGGLTAVYDSGYHYLVSPDEDAKLRAGATWSDAQLGLSIGAGLLKNITDTVTTVKSPNVKGNNIELVAGAAVGSLDQAVTIDLSAGYAALTTPQKAALAAAERGDATLAGNIVTIAQPRPINVATGTGALTATAAAGDLFIGSEEDLRINQISARDNIRIKAAGSLINATAAGAGIVNVTGGNMILESANGGIGAIPDPTTGPLSSALRISPQSGSSLIARAAGDIWIETPGDLAVDTIFSRNNVKLDSVGSILDMPGDSTTTPAVNIRSKNVSLTSRTGSIGEDDNGLDVGVNKDGEVDATTETAGKGIYLNGPTGEYFNVGSSTSGGSTRLSASESVKVKGSVTGPGDISLVSGGDVTLSTDADVHSTAVGVTVRSNTLTMEDDGTKAARLRSDVGTIDIETVGDATVTGIESGNGTASAARIVSTAGRVLDAGDTRLDVIADAAPAAKFTVAGQLGVGSNGNPLEVRVRDLNASSADGSVAIAAVGSVNIESVSAGDAVQITADGEITGDTVTSTGAGNQGADQSVTVTSTGGSVQLASVSGQKDVSVDGQTGVDTGTVESTGASVVLNSNGGNVVAGTTKAKQNVTVTAPTGSITAGTTTATDGNVSLTALGDIAATTTVAGGKVDVNSTTGSANLTTVTARIDVNVNGQTGVNTGTVVTTAGSVTLNSNGGNVVADTTTAERDVTMTAPTGTITAKNTTARNGSLTMNALGDINAGNAKAGGSAAINSQVGQVTVDTLSSGGAFAMTTRGDIKAGVLTSGGAISLTSTGGRIQANSTTSFGSSVDMTAQGSVDANNVGAATDITIASRNSNVNVGTGRANTIDLSAPGTVTGGSLNVGSRVNLAGQNVAASINSTGGGDVGGSITGFGGGQASNVKLSLNSPYAFRFATLATSTGDINITAGDLSVGSLWVGNRMTISNPFTRVVIDQNDRTKQGFDVQLYSAGNRFAFELTARRVTVDDQASLIARKPTHEVISPMGNNLSAEELGYREMAVLNGLPLPTDLSVKATGSDSGSLVDLVDVDGKPVATDEDCDKEGSKGGSAAQSAQCEEKKQ